MAHAMMPQFAPVHGTIIGCNELPMSTITEVLQSEPVQRLLNRQNVFLQNPVITSSASSDYSRGITLSRCKSNGNPNDHSPNNKPELSVIPILSVPQSVPQTCVVEDKHLLPSKFQGKSAVALVPIKHERRRCGHYEPCENIVCDVNFQQFADENSVSPLIAVNIDANEIDAPVTKHCKNNNCDALSIDHDRCRRAIIRCNRCDVVNKCDICLTILKTRKSLVNHNNCKKRNEYRHNRTSRGQILRDRMRQREIQILEAAKIKKYDYEDPLTGHERAMECLQKNSELIVIPKTPLTFQQHPTIRITSVTGSGLTSNSQNSEIYEQIMSRFPVVFPQQGILLGKRGNSENDSTSLKQARIVGNSGQNQTENLPSISGNNRETIITVTRIPARNFVKPVDVNKLMQTPIQTNNSTLIQPERFFMPIRVVQTQGIPKYCLVEDNTIQSSTTNRTNVPSKIITPRPSTRVVKTETIDRNPRKNDQKTEQNTKRFKPGLRRGRRKKTGTKRAFKSFECTFCFKKFTTDWYFKLHIAKHKGEIKFTCKFCKKPFMHIYNMTKHVVTMHKKEAGDESFIEENDEEGRESSLNCTNCASSFESRTAMENHPCRIFCLRCNARILDGNLMLHLKTKHIMTDEKAVEEYERQIRQKRQNSIAAKNRAKTKRGYQISEARRTKMKEDSQQIGIQRGNGFTKRRRHGNVVNEGQGLRRLTRRRNNSQTEQIENILINKTEIVEEDKISEREDFDRDQMIDALSA